MSEAREYDGEIEVVDGRLQLPEKYAEATQFVVRQRTLTSDIRSGAGIDSFPRRREADGRGVNNPHVDADEVILKKYGEPEETYRVVDDDG